MTGRARPAREGNQGAGGDIGRPVNSVTTLVAPADHWVSAAAVRQAIGSWAYSLRAGERRPSEEAVRLAVGVACAVRESATDPERRAWLGAAGAGEPTGSVPADTVDLGARAGVPEREVAPALDLLASAGVVTLQRGPDGVTVALSSAVLAPFPAVARVDWRALRARLATVGGSIAAAQAVLRELVAQLGAVGEPAGATGAALPPVRASVRELGDATGFGRSTVSAALAALEQARVLDVEVRAGRTTRFVVRPAVFGWPDETLIMEPAVTAGQGSLASHTEERGEGRRRRRGAPAMMGGQTLAAPDPGTVAASAAAARIASVALPPDPVSRRGAVAPAAAPVLIGTFAGTPIHAPAGTPLVVECDAEGRWWCRVGPFLRIGPVEEPG